MRRQGKQGFTLVELMIVVSIITVLSIMGGLSYGEVLKRSRDAKRKSDIEQIRSALEMYRTDLGYYPNLGAGIQTVATGLALSPTYIPKVPDDQFSTTQHYYYKATNLSSGNYYGYCLSALLEQTPNPNPDTTCAGGDINPTYNYGRRSP